MGGSERPEDGFGGETGGRVRWRDRREGETRQGRTYRLQPPGLEAPLQIALSGMGTPSMLTCTTYWSAGMALSTTPGGGGEALRVSR